MLRLKRWEIALLAGAVMAGGLLAFMEYELVPRDTTWGAAASPRFAFENGGTAATDVITVKNTGHALGGYVDCFVWGFSKIGHVASGFATLPVTVRPGRTWKLPVTVYADGYPPRDVAGVTGFTAACYEGY